MRANKGPTPKRAEDKMTNGAVVVYMTLAQRARLKRLAAAIGISAARYLRVSAGLEAPPTTPSL